MNSDQSSATVFFLHGLDSSNQGYKARWFNARFPQMRIHNYRGELADRLAQLKSETQSIHRLILVGSSFGGLMAACHAAQYPAQCAALVLLAPALNFHGYQVPTMALNMPVTLLIGKQDTVCPPDLVLPRARQSFSRLNVHLVEDDHLLHHSFQQLDWPNLLQYTE